MPRAGWAIRNDKALAAASAKLCGCGHEVGRHFEVRRHLPITAIEQIADPVPNPDYRALHFHCNVEGCECVIDRSAA